MRDDIKRKLTSALACPLEKESDAVYILMQTRKLLDINGQQKQFPVFRLLCNWCVHSELTNESVQEYLKLLDEVLGPWLDDIAVSSSGEQSTVSLLSLESAREDFLNIIFEQELNLIVPHVFLPEWWSSLLQLIASVVSDIPWKLTAKTTSGRRLKSALIRRTELLHFSTDEIQSILRIHWEFKRASDGKTKPYPVDLYIYKNVSESFGRQGKRVEMPSR